MKAGRAGSTSRARYLVDQPDVDPAGYVFLLEDDAPDQILRHPGQAAPVRVAKRMGHAALARAGISPQDDERRLVRADRHACQLAPARTGLAAAAPSLGQRDGLRPVRSLQLGVLVPGWPVRLAISSPIARRYAARSAWLSRPARRARLRSGSGKSDRHRTKAHPFRFAARMSSVVRFRWLVGTTAERSQIGVPGNLCRCAGYQKCPARCGARSTRRHDMWCLDLLDHLHMVLPAAGSAGPPGSRR